MKTIEELDKISKMTSPEIYDQLKELTADDYLQLIKQVLLQNHMLKEAELNALKSFNITEGLDMEIDNLKEEVKRLRIITQNNCDHIFEISMCQQFFKCNKCGRIDEN